MASLSDYHFSIHQSHSYEIEHSRVFLISPNPTFFHNKKMSRGRSERKEKRYINSYVAIMRLTTSGEIPLKKCTR